MPRNPEGQVDERRVGEVRVLRRPALECAGIAAGHAGAVWSRAQVVASGAEDGSDGEIEIQQQRRRLKLLAQARTAPVRRGASGRES